MKNKRRLVLVFAAVIVSGFGAFAHAQMMIVGTNLPSIPASVTATVIPPSQISVSWGSATESSGTIEGYYVYRNGARITTTAGVSLVDSGLTPGIYNYTVAAYDANGNVSNQSSAASATLLTYTTPPTTPTNVTIAGTTSTNSAYATTTLTISWGASTDVISVAGYNVYRNGTSIVSSTSAFTGTSITDIVPPGTYAYTVIAYDAAQNFSNRSMPVNVAVIADTTAPSVPVNISTQQVSATGVNLSWASSTDNVGVAGYEVFRDGMQIASVAGPAYADTGLSQNIAYSYVTKAYDVAGNISGPSIPVNATLQLTSGPIAPYALSATLLGTSTAKLSWAPAGGVLTIAGYTVYRNGTQIASVSSTSYLDGGLVPGTYVYGVTATDVSGAVSPTSTLVNIVIPMIVSTPAPIVVAPIVIASSSLGSPVGVAPGGSSVSTGFVSAVFTQFLYFGLRSTQVQALQSLLAMHGYLTPVNATGFFGTLTLGALQKFQCDQKIVCTGGAGWGAVGPKTRNALNGLQGITTSSSSTSSAFSTSALNAEIQALEVELLNLKQRVQ